MIRGFRQIVSLTALSRVFGLIRDMCFSHFLGASGLMDTWVIAFRIPNLSRRLFGEGAAAASFIPVYSELLEKDPKSAPKLADTMVTFIFALLTAIMVLAWIGIGIYKYFWAERAESELILSLSAAMLPYMVMICTVAILSGILNVHRHFAAPAAAPIILNVCIIAAAVGSGLAFKDKPLVQVWIIAGAVLVAGALQIASQLYPLRQKGVILRPGWEIHTEGFKKIAMLMGPMIIGLTATQINTLADDIIAWCLSGSEEKGEFFTFLGNNIRYPIWRGSVSHLYYSQRLYQYPLGVLGISLATAIFPVMSSDAARGDFESLRLTVAKGLKATAFIALPAMAGLFLVSRPLTAVLLQHGKFTAEGTDKTALTLTFYSIGLAGYFSQQILTRAFYSLQNSKIPMISAIIAVLLNVSLNLTLIWPMGTAGLALSTAVCSYLQVFILLGLFSRLFHKSPLEGMANPLIKTFAATALMTAVGLAATAMMRGLAPGTRSEAIRLAVLVFVCAGVYFFAAKAMRIEMLSLFTGPKKKKQISDNCQ